MRIVYVTDKQLGDEAEMCALAAHVAHMLGQDLPEQTNEWKRAHRSLLEMLPAPTFPHMRLTTEDICCHLCEE